MEAEIIWRVWECPTCKSQTKLSYEATEADYHRIKECVSCGDLLKWSHNKPE